MDVVSNWTVAEGLLIVIAEFGALALIATLIVWIGARLGLWRDDD